MGKTVISGKCMVAVGNILTEEGCVELFSDLTNKEYTVMKYIMEYRPGARVRSANHWLKCRGLGPKLLGKLRKHGMIEAGSEWKGEVSCRAWCVLNNAGIPLVKEDVKKAIASGKLAVDKWRNYGVKTDDELRAWAGAPSRPKTVMQKKRPNTYLKWKVRPITGKPSLENV